MYKLLEILIFSEKWFFIEAGAWNGEEKSNTIFMEVIIACTVLLGKFIKCSDNSYRMLKRGDLHFNHWFVSV